jgi:16S rRNA (uracil1498-N3)-methyltransferase
VLSRSGSVSRYVRAYCGPLSPGERQLDAGVAHYLAHVLRLAPGNAFIAFDPEAALEADAVIVSVHGRRVRVRVGEPRRALTSRLEVTLIQALARPDRVDQIVRDATAVGVARLVLVETVHCVERKRAAERSARQRTIAVEAARQSGRGDLPLLEGPLDLQSALASVEPASLKLLLEPRGERSLWSALATWDGLSALALFVGPEGGFSADELVLAERAGFSAVSCGRFTLRSETAALAALGAVLARAHHASGSVHQG